ELIEAEADPPSRYHIHNTAGKTKLTVRNLTEVDTGSYYCGAVYDIGVTLSRVDLRVITFMEPLKPFLLIVAEVIVLVSVILLCERRGSRQHKGLRRTAVAWRRILLRGNGRSDRRRLQKSQNVIM
ncbi:hypothetical protein CRUP_015054, partial [Coryphaenoides rupestris]